MDRWISGITYQRLSEQLELTFGLNPAVALHSRRKSSLPDRALFRGSVNLRAGTVQFTPFSLWPGPTAAPWPITPGDYTLQLAAADGTVLYETSFQPAAYDSCEQPVSLSGGFILPVAANSGFRSARVLHRGITLDSREASPNAPLVANLSPNGGEVVNGPRLAIAWEAQDGDGDTLTYDVQYSGDGGESWRTLQADWPTNRLEMDVSYFAATAKGLVRVIASDGFNTGVRASQAVFTLPSKAPQLGISSPVPGQLILPQQSVTLKAFGLDEGGGLLEGTNLVWESSRKVRLGTGAMVVLNAADLPSGEQEVRLTAWNRQGQSNSTSVDVFVATSAPAAFADLKLTAVLGTEFPTVGSTMVWTLHVENAGQDTATNVRLTNSLSAGVDLISVESSVGTWQAEAGHVVVNLGSLTNEQIATVTLVLSNALVGAYTNLAQVMATEPDPMPANNRVTRVVQVSAPGVPKPDLVVSLGDLPTSVKVGETLNYEVTVGNAGTIPAANVRLVSLVPSGLLILSADTSQGNWGTNGNQVLMELGSIPVGGRATIHVEAQAIAAGPSLFQTRASAVEEDAEPGDNLMTAIVRADVSLTLLIARDGSAVRLEWDASTPATLEGTTQLRVANSWTPVDATPTLEQGRWRVVLPVGTTVRFFRLRGN